MALDFLFGSSPPASMTNTLSDTDTALPAWLQDLTRGIGAKATDIANQPYQTYDQPRLAEQSPLQQQAASMTQANVGAWQPNVQFASQQAPGAVQNYMNPYQSNVIDRMASLGQRNLTENLLPQVNSTFMGAGQFGSTRNADFTNRALRDTNESILGQQGQLLNQGYQQAIQNFQNDATRLGNLGQMQSQLGFQDAGMLDVLGKQQQQQTQKGLDIGYQDFLQQRDYPKSQAEWLNNIIRGLDVSKTSSTTQSAIDPNAYQTVSPLQQAAAAFAGTKGLLSPQPQQAGK